MDILLLVYRTHAGARQNIEQANYRIDCALIVSLDTRLNFC